MAADMDVAHWIDLRYALKQCLKLAQDIPSIQQRDFVTFVPSKANRPNHMEN